MYKFMNTRYIRHLKRFETLLQIKLFNVDNVDKSVYNVILIVHTHVDKWIKMHTSCKIRIEKGHHIRHHWDF